MEDMEVLMASNRVSSCPCPAVVLNSTVSDEVADRVVVAKSVDVWVLSATILVVKLLLVLISCLVTMLLNVESVEIVAYRELFASVWLAVVLAKYWPVEYRASADNAP